MKCWHPKFDVHNIPDVPEVPLPSQPRKEKVESVNQFLSSGKIRNETLKSIMKETAEKFELEKKLQSQSGDQQSVDKETGLPMKILSMVKQKEKFLEEEKLCKNEEIPKTKRKAEMKQIANTLKNHYSIRNVSNQFLVQLVDYIHQCNRSLSLSKAEIQDLILQIVQICPDWLQSIQNPQGRIIRMNKNIKMFEVLHEIDNLK